MASYIVCCPIRGYEGLHMSFSKIYDDVRDANDYMSRLSRMEDITASYNGRWGPESKLYVVDHPMYENDRPPHVKSGPSQDIVVELSNAYVKKINDYRR